MNMHSIGKHHIAVLLLEVKLVAWQLHGVDEILGSYCSWP